MGAGEGGLGVMVAGLDHATSELYDEQRSAIDDRSSCTRRLWPRTGFSGTLQKLADPP